MKSQIVNRRSKIVIAGAGPAGSSLAIRLALLGFETVLIEREQFPRDKLCGEFISPECLEHFKTLGVDQQMLSAGGERIHETRFFETGGRSVTVPSIWFGDDTFALSLSRAEMDMQLLERARNAGAFVREETSVIGVETDGGKVKSVRVRTGSGVVDEIAADLFVDATGRSRVLAKLFERGESSSQTLHPKPTIVGFKTHLDEAHIEAGICEIYSFPGGYAGLSKVERDRFNLCFLIKAADVRAFASDADEIMRRVVRMNIRAAQTLPDTAAPRDWLAVSIDGFGTKKPAAATNLFTIGDSASFIDPFTGSGMFMALESSAVLASVIDANVGEPKAISAEYSRAYANRFTSRLRVCSVLRRTAFLPRVATAVVFLLSLSSGARRRLTEATRK